MSSSTSLWSPLRQPAFRGLWLCGGVFFVGNGMQAMAAAWLMVELTGSSFLAALVQTAVFLPMFLLALPAGVLADTNDRRRLISGALIAQTAAFALLTLLVLLGWGGPATVLLLVFPHLPLPRIIAADIAYAVPLTLVAGLGHASLGSVDWPLLLQLLAGSLPGIWLGSRLVSRTPERLIRSALSVLLAWAGAKLVLI